MKIRIRNISKSFHFRGKKKFTVLKDITFSIGQGEFVVILGESGCGKTTFLNLLAGLLPLSSGEILVDDEKITGPHPSRAILFQQPSLLPWLNVQENIVFGCKMRGDTENLRERSDRLTEMMGLKGFEKVRPHELSLGMAQRVCLARALIGHPQILILDEPFSALDTFTRNYLQQMLIRFWQAEKFTVVFVTHDINEAILLGNRIFLLGRRPCRLVGTFDVNLHYPRDISSRPYMLIRTNILQRFKKIFLGNQFRMDDIPGQAHPYKYGIGGFGDNK
ncbi:MAG: ABC transporter ATP-binding protein [Desulfococcaceae bacterium]|jgi:ABC-type nitrate/sulfonate/bicarbonate transport system ATPase subunit|nr:ABC transporter ATP-binding protein [Desulfococcaceae bacterium]